MPTAIKIPTGTWTADPAHSSLGFSVKHLGIATVRGTFGEFEGKIVLDGDLADAKVTGSAKVASIDTSQPDRDAHLRSADFFDAEQFPELTFESTSVTEIDEETFEITGDLTMHGVTKAVRFPLTAERTADGIYALADLPILFSDWNIANPSVGGLVTTASSGTLEVLVHLTTGPGNPAASGSASPSTNGGGPPTQITVPKTTIPKITIPNG